MCLYFSIICFQTNANKTEMSCLVFWYGTDEDHLESAFSFIQRKKTMSYEEGCDKHLAIPSKIKAKMDKNKSLTQNETSLVKGIEEIQRDYKLPTVKRLPWLFDFEEEYEIEDNVDSEQDDEIMEEPEPKKKKKKKEPIEEDEEKDTKKGTQKKIKRKRQSDPKAQDSMKKTKVTNRKLDEEIMEEVAQEEAFFQEDAPSDDDKGDDDFSVEQEESESDEEDELYEEKTKKETKPKANKAPKPSKVKAAKEKSVNKKSKTDKKDKKDKIRDFLEEEQKKFEACEEVFLQFIFKLNKDNVEMEKVEKYLRKILDNVELLTPSFIQESQIGMLIKKLRKRVKEDDKMNSLCKTITAKMKSVYSEKLDLVPAGFTPKPSKKFVKVMVSRSQCCFILYNSP